MLLLKLENIVKFIEQKKKEKKIIIYISVF